MKYDRKWSHLLAERAHEVGRLGVGGHMRPQRRPPTERLPALPARELPLARVCHLMGWVDGGEHSEWTNHESDSGSQEQ